MPRTRYEMGRDAKIKEILALARRRLLEGGYAALSVKAIARELGLAQNAVYWYFPSRDHLFIAVLRDLVSEFPTRRAPGTQTLGERAVWFVNRIADFHPLAVDMYERARSAEVVADFSSELEASLRGVVVRLVAPHFPADEVEVAADSFWATIEGVLLRRLPRRRREAVVRFAMRQLVGEEALAQPHWWPSAQGAPAAR